jgi:hypothetical protein
MISLAYTDQQQIDELLYEIREEFENSEPLEPLEIFEDLDSLLASIRQDS